MIIKGIFLFLAFIGVLGIFGKWRFPGQQKLSDAKCPNCQRYRIGKGPCQCQKCRP
ncbi:hypothetical protein SAMN04488005_3195 [Yoonia tamlensis]|uniref:Uncharacterized protein n=1 Tax=Yoonia tamlensis TaxID=390270 RepID=A0A1I6I1K3_9RHOB|nr:hypothetical protein SAMN04488005_3195 [Yoonia tamlensis]